MSLQTAAMGVSAAERLSQASALDINLAYQLAADIFGYHAMLRAKSECRQRGHLLRSKRLQQLRIRRRLPDC